MSNENTINLTLPVDAAYVSTVRLTASSIANRMGFDIDAIEDIKAAVSEAGTYIVKNYSSAQNNNLDVKFNMNENDIEIILKVKNAEKISVSNEEDMGLLMVKALMTEFEISFYDNDFLFIRLVKEKNSREF